MVAYDDLHLRAQEIVMRVIGIACGVPAVRNEEHIFSNLLDRAPVIVPVLDLRLGDADLPSFCTEVVADDLAVVRLIPIHHDRRPDELLPLLVRRVLHSPCRKGRRVPVHLHTFGLQADRTVLQLALAVQVHELRAHRIDDGVFRGVHDQRINTGGAAGECVRQNGAEGIRNRGSFLGLDGHKSEKGSQENRRGTSAGNRRRKK